MIRFAAEAFVKHAHFERLAAFMARSMRGSPPDEIAVADPELVRDYFRATRMFATGRFSGYVNEQTEFAQGSEPPPLAGTGDWRILVAAHDVLHDPAHVAAYWRRVLPEATLSVIPDTGRFLALSHPHHVVDALAD
jgi:pimeloyl-ACP methyl ester carboxylesterase